MERRYSFTEVIRNIFNSNIYRWVLIGAFLLITLLPIAGQKMIIPLLYNQMMNNVLTEAKQIATHISRHQNIDLKFTTFHVAMDKLRDDFNLYKIKLFDKDGYVTFSTDKKDIGSKNKYDYFYNEVANGEIYYNIATKGKKTLEGDVVPRDVAEIYVPIMRLGKFNGSSEIYYDITDKRDAFDHLMDQITFIYIIFSLILLTLLLIILYNASKANLIEKEKDNQLFQQSKMASMGEMIGNIAHQWRQPLSAISSAASGLLLHKEMGILEDDTFKKSTERIISSTEYLSKTIDDFRNFFNVDKTKKSIEMTKLINETLSLVNTTLDSANIHCVTAIENKTFISLENELKQAIMNIIVNAKDILVEKNIDTKYIFIDGYVEGEDYILSIADNAGGVPDDIIEKIFEPYFTTKHQSQGTGIGLFMTREIIVKHLSGALDVYNDEIDYEEKILYGAKFVIKLPMEQKDENEV